MGMHDMSRRSKAEYIKVRRERYEVANPAKKSRIIDEVMETTGFTRKYVINLLNGKIEYRERKGRGKTYGDETRPVLAAIWREARCPCTPYFKAEIELWVDEYEQYVANIAPAVKSAILAMSDRKTQWTVLSPTWNRGQYTTLEALKRIERKFPFAFTSLRSDNGSEIINYHLAAFLGKSRPGLCLSRSRPRKCNDNAQDALSAASRRTCSQRRRGTSADGIQSISSRH